MALDIQIPGYQIKEEIGRGGMAAVYRALQESLNRDVALKIMNPSLAVDDDFKKRFHNEGQIIAKLNHSNIVTIFDIGDFQQHYYFSMEFLPGGTLRDKINQGLSLAEALEIAKKLAKALGFAHQADVIHRDIKPPNVLFRADGSPVLTDFGIAKMPSEVTQMTAAGYTFGSAGYMSPEQSLGNPIDQRSDLYSFGVLFWEMLTGNKPYNADNTFALAYKHATEPVPELPENLAVYQPILNKLLAKQPGDRFATAEEFAAAVETLQSELSPSGGKTILGVSSDVTQIRTTGNAAATAVSHSTPGESAKRSSGLMIGVAAGVVLLGGAAAAYFVFNQATDSKITTPESNGDNGSTLVIATAPETTSSQPTISSQTTAEQPSSNATATNTTTESPAVSTTETAETAATSTSSVASQNTTATVDTTTTSAVTEPPLVTNTTTPPPTDSETNNQNQAIADEYLEKAQQLLSKDAWEQSLEQIESGLNEVAGNEELLALRSEIQAQLSAESEDARRQRLIRVLLLQAQRQWDDRQFEEPAGDNASETYRQILQFDPTNEEARDGMQRLGRMRLVMKSQQEAQQLLREGKLKESLATIERGLILSPGYDGLLELRDEVESRLKNQ